MDGKSERVKKRTVRNIQIAISAIIIFLSLAFVYRQTFKLDAPVTSSIVANETIEWHAFLVATNHYDVDVRNLKYAEADVEELHRSLKALGVKDENIMILKSSNLEFSLGSSKESIEDGFKTFLSKLTERSAAFVYLAGHGFCQNNWWGKPCSYYAPSDFQFEKTNSKRVSIDEMMKQLAKTKARFKWMCVDACRDPIDRGISSRSLSISNVPKGVVLTQSCKLGQLSFEAGKTEGAPFENGLFTRAFVDAFDGHAPEVDADQDGILTLGELRDYVEARVPRDAQQYLNAKQNPVFTSMDSVSLDAFANYALFDELPIMGHRPEDWQRGQKLREEAEELVKQGNCVGALEKINQAYRILYDVDEIALLKGEIERSLVENEAQKSFHRAEEELQARNFLEADNYISRALEFDPGNQSYKLFKEQLESERNAYFLSASVVDSTNPQHIEAGEAIVVKIAGIDVRFRWCPPGEFMMGRRPSENKNYVGEVLHKVKLTHGYWMAETEATQALWKATMGEENNPSFNLGDDLPVEQVSWDECQAFIERIQVHAPRGMAFQLPTEAQWEYSCRAGTDTQYSFGDEWDPSKANNGEKTSPVGSFDYANPWGIRDMHGNVREWIKDWIGSYSEEETTDPSGPEEGAKRVLRGGCARSEPYACLSGIRFSFPPDAKAWDLGFRLALTINCDEPTPEQPQLTTPSRILPEKVEDKEAYKSPYLPGQLRIVQIAGIAVRFRWCPPGEFTMGSPASEEGRNDNEIPHTVKIDRGFWLAETETSQELWKKVMRKNPSRFQGDLLPVERVSWEDCQDFISKIQFMPGGNYNNNNGRVLKANEAFHLPTEAQWEYACRAGTNTRYSFGDNWESSKSNNGAQGTTPVGYYRYANAWGLKDMHGNVWEWCENAYVEDCSLVDPTYHSMWLGVQSNNSNKNRNNNNGGVDVSRVGRGGGWDSDSDVCRSANRGWLSSKSRNGNLGFRLEISEVDPSFRGGTGGYGGRTGGYGGGMGGYGGGMGGMLGGRGGMAF